FNLRKPGGEPRKHQQQDDDLEHHVAGVLREHLQSLPARMKSDPTLYTDEHRATPFLNTVLINSILPGRTDISRLTLPFIEEICGLSFKQVDNRWYLPEQVVGTSSVDGFFEQEVEIKDETTAILWLRQRLTGAPVRFGELQPYWMKATGKLTTDLSTRLERY